MNPSTDRVAVPTNGHRPALGDDAPDASPAGEVADSGPSPGTAVPTVSPGQVIAGFGILAALLLLVLGRRRGRGG